MELVAPEVSSYLNGMVPPRHKLLEEMESYAEENNFPIIGPACGQVCYQVARMTKAKRIYELGSGFGYSTAWFAQAVKENGGGDVHHVVWDDDLSKQAKDTLDAMGYDNIVHYTVGEAVASLNETEGQFDLIFCDIDKQGYPEAIQASEEKLASGGTFIIDNMLWSGKIFDESDKSADTEGIRIATGLLANSDKWVSSLLPIRDGLLISTKL
jgi:predicted O-methyltransferase YrrM